MPYKLARYKHNRQLPPSRFIKETFRTVPLSHSNYEGSKFSKPGALAIVGKLKTGDYATQSILIPKQKYLNKIMARGGTIESTTISQMVADIAKKHNTTAYEVLDLIKQGGKHELEHEGTIEYVKANPHVSNDKAAELIAIDHISKDGLNYYKELNKAETKMETGGQVKETNDGTKGGILEGATDKNGGRGIKAVVKETGQPVLLGGNEVIINEDAANDNEKHTYTGTNKEVLNKINTSTGGREILKDGGDVCPCSLETGGSIMETIDDPKSRIIRDYKTELISLNGRNEYCEQMMSGSDEDWVKKEYGAVMEGNKRRIAEIEATLKRIDNKEFSNGGSLSYEQPIDEMAGGGNIDPYKNVSISVANAIKDILAVKYSSYKSLTPMSAQMLYSEFKDYKSLEKNEDGLPFVEYDDREKTLKNTMFKALEKDDFVRIYDWQYRMILANRGMEFIDMVKPRIETRRGLKYGYDLFPETSGIKEVMDKVKNKIDTDLSLPRIELGMKITDSGGQKYEVSKLSPEEVCIKTISIFKRVKSEEICTDWEELLIKVQAQILNVDGYEKTERSGMSRYEKFAIAVREYLSDQEKQSLIQEQAEAKRIEAEKLQEKARVENEQALKNIDYEKIALLKQKNKNKIALIELELEDDKPKEETTKTDKPNAEWWHSKVNEMDDKKIYKDISKLEIGDFVGIRPEKRNSGEAGGGLTKGVVTKIAPKNITIKTVYGGWGDNDYELMELKFSKDRIEAFYKPKK